MITFYFNSNLPEYYTGDLCEVFDNLMLKFILLLNDKKLPINGYIATNNQPSTILICGKTLKSLIDNFNIAEKDKYKEHRKKLYSFFTRYPIDLDVRVEEVFSEEELTSSIKFHGRDATDLFIVHIISNYKFSQYPCSRSFITVITVSKDSSSVYLIFRKKPFQKAIRVGLFTNSSANRM